MKVQCPRCSAQVPAANLNVDTGWTKCVGCDELFPLADAAHGSPALAQVGRVERPYNTRAVVERTADELLIHVPAEGRRFSTFELLGFTTIWLAFTTFWTVFALVVFDDEGPDPFRTVFVCFSIPPWLVGFGMVGAVAWKVWGTKSVRINRGGMRTHLRCLAWSRSRSVELDRVQHARHYDPKVEQEGVTTYATEIVYHGGSFALPVNSDDEEKWLIAEINDFLQSLPRDEGGA